MEPLTEREAERRLAAHALTAAYPGLIGLTLDLPPATVAPAGRSRLRHGFLIAEAGRVVLSGPPSPGLEVAVDRMADDLGHAATLIGRAAAARGAAVRVNLEAGTDDHSPTGMRRRWAVAHAIAPVLAAAFANAPVSDGPRAGWRSSPRRPGAADPGRAQLGTAQPGTAQPGTAQPGTAQPGTAQPGLDPGAAWARDVLDAPISAPELSPATFRQWIRHGRGRRPGVADLDRHERAFRPPVAARGILTIDVTDRLPGQGWQVAAAVVSTLVEDPQAATAALVATAALRDSPSLWERAARDALTDPDLATAARSLFLSAYGALARRGAPRPIRNAVAAYAEHFVLAGRCPADDQRPADDWRRADELPGAGDPYPTDNRRTAEIRENRT
jgi:glutamate--cysteine ligase